eukprot:Nk52_evm1s107 gene=Nk52_evmTU1s107
MPNEMVKITSERAMMEFFSLTQTDRNSVEEYCIEKYLPKVEGLQVVFVISDDKVSYSDEYLAWAKGRATSTSNSDSNAKGRRRSGVSISNNVELFNISAIHVEEEAEDKETNNGEYGDFLNQSFLQDSVG